MNFTNLFKRVRGAPRGVPELLGELEGCTHVARVQRMVQLGSDPSQKDLILALAGGNVYERRLALYSVYSSRDAKVLAIVAPHPSRLLARFSAQLLGICADDVEVARLLRLTSRTQRRDALRALRNARRFAIIDAFVEELVRTEPEALMATLPYASESLAARLLPQVAQAGDALFWSRFALAHCALAQAHWALALESGNVTDHRQRRNLRVTLLKLADKCPSRAMALLEACLRVVPLGDLPLNELSRIKHLSSPIAAAILEAEEAPLLDFTTHASALTSDQRLALVRRGSSRLSLSPRWLKGVAPAERRTLAEVALSTCRDDEGCVASGLVEVLPSDLREGEALRHLALPALATRPAIRARYAALLPYSKAEEHLRPLLAHSDPEIRIAALSASVNSVRFERQRSGDALRLVAQRRNEQDPVRLAALRSIASLPPITWRDVDLATLAAIVRDALKATDLSTGSVSQIYRLLWRLLGTPHAPWAESLLMEVLQNRGSLSVPTEGSVSAEMLKRVDAVIGPVLDAWRRQTRYDELLQVLSAFGRHLHLTKNARAMAEYLAREVKDRPTALAALSAVKSTKDPSWYATLLPRLLADDESWGLQPDVLAFLSRSRQDLLPPFMGRKILRGRFGEAKVRIIPSFEPCWLWRWTPSLQRAWGEGLEHLLDDQWASKRDAWTKISSINQLSRLDLYVSDRLRAHANDDDFAVRDVALRGLGRLDDGSGVTHLIEALGDDRGRVAIYALRDMVLAMPRRAALKILDALPLTRVTVAKEVVRLIGDLGGDDAFQALERMAHEALHPDVRGALLRSLWAHLARPEAWDLLDRAAAEAEDSVLEGVLRLPADPLTDLGRKRFARLFEALVRHRSAPVALAAMRRLGEEPVGPPGAGLLGALGDAATSPSIDLRQAAAKVMIAMRDSLADSEVVEYVGRCRIAGRRALADFVDVFVEHSKGGGPPGRDMARAALQALEGDECAVSLRVRIVHCLPLEEICDVYSRLDLHADAMPYAQAVVIDAAERLPPDKVAVLERRLRLHHHASLRRIGLTLLQRLATKPPGWGPEQLEALELYRRDKSPWVIEAAQFTFTTSG